MSEAQETLHLDPVDRLIWDEAPKTASAVAVLDAPALVPLALQLTDDVRVFCDDLRDALLVPEHLLVTHPSDLAGVDLALARLPKSLAALDEMVVSVQGAQDVTFIGGARVKHMNLSMNEVLGRHFTAVNASLGRQKSRVLRAWGPEGRESEWPKVRHHDDYNITVAAHGATFDGARIDPGTKLLLSQLKKMEGEDVLDFGCGNGALSMWLARRHKRVSAVDVSWSAVTGTMIAAVENRVKVDVSWADGISGYADASFDAIVTNPPFHDGVAKDSAATLAMFDDAARVLRPGGQLWCVYNSHLPYRKHLNQVLGQTRLVTQNRNYTVAVSTRR
ncbi:MAG: methyltransferase [Tessaracoccus sp.]